MSPPHSKESLTLLELLIAISLLGMLVLGFMSISLFSQYHVKNADIRMQLQNEASSVIEHMSKQIVKAIGNEKIYLANTVVYIPTNNPNRHELEVFIDASGNGQREANTDYWIAYRLDDAGNDSYKIQYCSQCSSQGCNNCSSPNRWEVLSAKVREFVPYVSRDVDSTLLTNVVDIQLTVCADPDGIPNACGIPDNPQVQMRTQIKMPAVSTN